MNSRRTFLKQATGLAAIPLLNLTGTHTAWAANEVKVSESDQQAAALGYKHDAANVDTVKYPKKVAAATDLFPAGAEQFCDNCGLYGTTADAGWGTCTFFPGKLVAAKGWCNGWVPIP